MENKYNRNNRIAEALSIRGWKQVDLCEHTGIKKSSINGWIKQNWQPKQESLYKMAKALDVSEMWLAGYDVDMERPASRVKADALAEIIKVLRTNDKYRKIVDIIIHLDEDNFILVENIVNKLKPHND